MSRRCNDISEQGFTLVEVLVAFVVASVMTGAVLLASSTASDQIAKARTRMNALPLASAIIAERMAKNYQPGEWSGTRGQLRWESQEQPVAASSDQALILAAVRVDIMDADGRRLVHLEARKLKRSGPAT